MLANLKGSIEEKPRKANDTVAAPVTGQDARCYQYEGEYMDKCRQTAADRTEYVGNGSEECDLDRTVFDEIGLLRGAVDEIDEGTHQQNGNANYELFSVHRSAVVYKR